MDKKLLFSALILLMASMFVACSGDYKDEEANPLEVVIGNNSRSDNSSDEGDEVTEWPSEAEMASQIYYPIGTKWQEVWAAERWKKQEDGIKSVHKAPQYSNIKNHDSRYEPYEYFTITFEVDKDTVVCGRTLRHVSLNSDFVPPTDIEINEQLLDESEYTDYFIEEDAGVIYITHDYSFKSDGSDYHKDLLYDFVWTDGKELSYVQYCMHSPNDLMDTLGIVSPSTVRVKTLLDGTDCLYMPSAKLYRGIGFVNTGLHHVLPGILPTMLFEIKREPVGIARFYRDGKLLYEDKEMLDLLDK